MPTVAVVSGAPRKRIAVVSGAPRIKIVAGGPRGPAGPGGTDPDAVHVDVANELASVPLKATPDGGDFFLIEDSAAGGAKKKATLADVLGGRLTADRTYYVAPTGNDGNDGLTPATPFATIQFAVNLVTKQLDMRGFTVSIQLADGSYAPFQVSGAGIGQASIGSLNIQGNLTTPGNVILQGAPPLASAVHGGGFALSGARLAPTSGGGAMSANMSGRINYSTLEFAAHSGPHVQCLSGSFVLVNGSYTILGSASVHWTVSTNSTLICAQPVTLTGTPAFSFGFLECAASASMNIFGASFAGAATGRRFLISGGAVVDYRAAEETLPGDQPGILADGSFIRSYVAGAGRINVGVRRISQHAGNYGLIAGDANYLHTMTSANANTLTVPNHATWPHEVGSQIPVMQLGTGQTTVVAAAGVTIQTPLTLKARAQYSRLLLEKIGTDEWMLSGDLATS